MASGPTAFRPSLAQTAGVSLILGVMVVRVTSATDPFPGWSGDPFRLPSPILGITPSISLALDLMALLGAALALSRGTVRRITWMLLGLTSAGALAAGWHARPGAPASLDNLVLGSSWVTAFFGAIAVRHAAERDSIRRIAIACVLGIIPLLVLKAITQVYLEHPETVREYQRSRQDFLESQGWTVGSPMALAYERRLLQAEGSGWFGLANVYASLVATGSVAFVGLAWAAWRSRVRGVALALLAFGVLAGTGTFLAGSKGGIAAVAVGLVLLAVIPQGRRLGTRERSSLGWLGGAVVVAALSAVVVRGWIGERIGELSILFRWFYMQGAARIIAEHPISGVGPAGFKDAYMLLKNPISPEDVASPHSILWDYAATLGLGGVCLGFAWMTMVVCAGRGSGAGNPSLDSSDEAPVRGELRLVAIVAAAGIVAAAWLEQPIATVASTLLRFAGIALCGVVSWAVIRAMRAGPAKSANIAFAAAALALAAHCQIEMTPITPGAALWVMLLIGLAGVDGGVNVAHRRRPRLPVWLVPAAAGVALVIGALSVWRWEFHLRVAYEFASPVAESGQRATAVFGGRPEGDSAPSIARDLGAAIGRTVDPSPRGIGAALTELRSAVLPLATAQMRAAHGAEPSHFATSRALGRLCLLEAEILADPARGIALREEAEAIALAAARRWNGGSSAWAWVATTREVLARSNPGGSEPRGVIDALRHAAELAPYEPQYQVKLALALDALPPGDPAVAAERAEWAARAIQTDGLLRLDPLRRLSDADRATMQRLANSRGF